METLKYIGLFLLAGAVMTVGMRAVEWLIPQPESRIFVCMASDVGEIEVCEQLEQLKKKTHRI